MDYSDEYTEAQLEALEKKLNITYKRAWNELQGEATEYFEQFADRYQKEYQAYKQGKYTKEQFQNWYLSQVARGKQWEAKRDTMAWMMEKTNEMACQLVNGTTPSVFSLNANYLAYLTEKDYDVSFNLVDEGTIKNLVMEESNNVEFKTLGVNPKRDYKWNKAQIQSALVSGILQGESISKLSQSFMVVQERNKNAAIRNARTAVTSAQNAGRISTMRKSKEKGIDVRKQWKSAHDSRVRHSHAVLDGQIRDIEEPFDNGLQYPADSDGIPAEVYNCRCTLKYIYPKYQNIKSNELYRESRLEDESYQDWLKRKKSKADVMMEYAQNSTTSMQDKFNHTVKVTQALNKLPNKVRTMMNDAKIVLDSEYIRSDPLEKVIELSAKSSKRDVWHETGHLVEEQMLNKKSVEAYKQYLTEGLTINDMYTKTYYYANGKEREIYLIKGDRFETEYQSRLYVKYLYEAVNNDGTIKTEYMLESVSEPFSKYMAGESISDEAKKMLEDAIS